MHKQLIIGDVTQELASTRRMLESLPEDHLEWKPHEKSMSLGGLSTHLVNLLNWQAAILRQPVLDLSSVPSRREPLTRKDAILAEFEENIRVIEKKLAEINLESLTEEWTLRNGDVVIYRGPRAAALRTFGISHMIHHRAQLGVYLRLLHVPVPGMYGPTADEQIR